MDSTLEDFFFESLWTTFLNLIETVAFDHLKFHKIFTYSYAVRPRLYPVLKRQFFIVEEQLKNAIKINNKWEDIFIHAKFRDKLSYKSATLKDSKQVFEWANEITTRKNSINKEIINWDKHQEWFKTILIAKEVCKIFMFSLENPVGVLRLDKINEAEIISFSVDKEYRGKGYGFRMIYQILNDFPDISFIAEVLNENESSHKIFIKNGFKVLKSKGKTTTYQKLKNG
jgi:RimJ/RimL family protein N-acetyltransferase